MPAFFALRPSLTNITCDRRHRMTARDAAGCPSSTAQNGDRNNGLLDRSSNQQRLVLFILLGRRDLHHLVQNQDANLQAAQLKPHGLRKTLGRRLAVVGAAAHEIVAALGHLTLAKRYTREADCRANVKLEGQKANKHSPNPSAEFGETAKM